MVPFSRSIKHYTRCALFAMFLFGTTRAGAQPALTMSRTDMYADFDTLVTHIQRISPHIAVKKRVWHYDALGQIARLRRHIDTLSSELSFELLISQVLNSCQDDHTSVMSYTDTYRKHAFGYNLYLPIEYIGGNYYLAKAFQTDHQVVPAGSVIIEVNGKKMDSYIQSLRSAKVMSYDLNRKKFYSEDFYYNLQTAFQPELNLVFSTPAGQTMEARLDIRRKVEFVNPIHDTIRNQVTYWADKQVLYLKLYRMDNQLISLFRRKIAQFGRSKQPLKKVIVDIRDNSGGNDQVWQAVYEAILPRKTVFPLTIDGYYPHLMSKEYLANTEIHPNSLQPDTSPLLKKYQLYHYLNKNWVLTPTDSSLNFSGKIVVVGNQHIYSAGASAMMLPNASHQDSIYSVGRSTGMFLGGGYSPVVFTLPHSKIVYRIEPAIEVTNVHQLTDLMHDSYEYLVPATLDELYRRENYRGNTLGSEYLKNFDPFIKKALEL